MAAKNKYFKMIGFWPEGKVYEAFVVAGAPAQATTVNPNTGHVLVKTFVSTIWEA